MATSLWRISWSILRIGRGNSSRKSSRSILLPTALPATMPPKLHWRHRAEETGHAAENHRQHASALPEGSGRICGRVSDRLPTPRPHQRSSGHDHLRCFCLSAHRCGAVLLSAHAPGRRMGAPPGGTLSFHRPAAAGRRPAAAGRPELFGKTEQLRISYKLEAITIDEQKQAPEIGTPEAAVQSCVNLLAVVTGIPEAKLAYYLDMYYQLRDAYEAAYVEEQLEAMRLEAATAAACSKIPVYPDPPRTMNTPKAPEDVKETPQSPASAPATAPLAGEPSGTTDSEAPLLSRMPLAGLCPLRSKAPAPLHWLPRSGGSRTAWTGCAPPA